METTGRADNYILGIEIKAEEAVISYYDKKLNKPVIYDLSGGYGQSGVPLVLQYIIEEDKWLIGEDALSNKEQEDAVLIRGFYKGLLEEKKYLINNREYLSQELLVIFIEKILLSVNNTNPKAKVTSLTVVFPDKHFVEISAKLKLYFEGISCQEVVCIPMTNAIAAYLIYEENYKEEAFKLFNYDYNECSIYNFIKNEGKYKVSCEQVQIEASLYKLKTEVEETFCSIYLKNKEIKVLSEIETEHIKAMMSYHFPCFFQKLSQQQNMKIYYNFVYPPFMEILTYEDAYKIVESYILEIKSLLDKEKIKDLPLILIGTGNKMKWVKDTVAQKREYKDMSQLEPVSKGACLIGINEAKDIIENLVESKNEEAVKYGIIVINSTEEFLPLMHGDNIFIVNLKKNNYKIEIVNETRSEMIKSFSFNSFQEILQRVNITMKDKEGKLDFEIELLKL